MLSHVKSVVAGKDDVGVVQLPGLPQFFDEVSYHVVHCEQGPQPVSVQLLHLGDRLRVQRRVVAQPFGFVRDVSFVVRG